LKHEYLYLREGTNYFIRFDDSEVSIAVENLMILITEGERRVLTYGIISTENKGVSGYGLGYIILKTNNNQKVQVEGVCWRSNFASFINEDDLETGSEADFFESKLVERFQVVLSSIINYHLGGASLVTSCGEGVLCKTKWYGYYQDRLKKTRILVWLEFAVFVVMVTMKRRV
jgi:hypothetical protein